MLNMNRTTLLGHAGRDPEIRDAEERRQGGGIHARHHREMEGPGGRAAENTEWHRIVVYGPVVEPVETMLRKGDAVLVEGRIATRAFRDKDGNDRAVTEIVVAGWQGTVNILSGRRARPDPGPGQAPGSRDVEEGGGAPESPE